jgi:hypothetical protein
MAGWVENASPAVDSASEYPEIIAVCVCLALFMTALVGLRVYVRAFMLKTMGVDDWIIVFSAICSIVYSGLCIGRKMPYVRELRFHIANLENRIEMGAGTPNCTEAGDEFEPVLSRKFSPVLVSCHPHN